MRLEVVPSMVAFENNQNKCTWSFLEILNTIIIVIFGTDRNSRSGLPVGSSRLLKSEFIKNQTLPSLETSGKLLFDEKYFCEGSEHEINVTTPCSEHPMERIQRSVVNWSALSQGWTDSSRFVVLGDVMGRLVFFWVIPTLPSGSPWICRFQNHLKSDFSLNCR